MKDPKRKETPMIIQMGIFAAILFVSQLISQLFPADFMVPTPLIGMIILYILLATHIIKLEQVEKLGDSLIGLIAFLFVPSGIQLAGSLGVMQREGIKDILVAAISTVILLVVITYVGSVFIKLHHRVDQSDKEDK